MTYPEYIEINNKKYKINTDFRVAIRCNEIAEDTNIGDFERTLAIIYTLFGEDALEDDYNYEKLIELALKYLNCGKELELQKGQKDMDYTKDIDLIEASFMSDYHIDLSNTKMHWWKFCKLINGLSNSELGNCCILNSVRNLRNMNVNEIQDSKEKQKILEAQKYWALDKKENHLTKEQEKSMEELNKILGI